MTHVNRGKNFIHILLQLLVDLRGLYHRIITEMDTFRCGSIIASYQILINILCHEGNHGSCCLTDGYQCSIQSHISIDLILRHAFCPETFSASSYIPVTHIIYKFFQQSCSFRNTVGTQIFINAFNNQIQFGQKPLVHNGQLLIIQSVFCCIKFINIGIQYEESIGIPECTHEFSLSFRYCRIMETFGQPGCGACIEVPADSICTMFLQCFHGINSIAF